MEHQYSNAFDAWKAIVNRALKQGFRYKDTRNRICLELHNLYVSVMDPSDHITKPIEHLQHIDDWLYPSLQEIADIIMSPDHDKVYGYAYGSRLFSYRNSINQIDDFAIPLLSKDPSSRRCVLSFFDPTQDSHPQARDVPGLIGIDIKLREGKLHATALIRSNDLFIGWPANIYQIYVVLEYICTRLDLQIGTISTLSTSAHVFEEHAEYIKKIV